MTSMDHRQLAVSCFNCAWDYLDQPQRSHDDDLAMIHSAHASRFHWGIAGGPLEWARGEWQIARVYAVLGLGESSMVHAKACLKWVESHDLGAFDAAFAHEALARAYIILGQPDRAQDHVHIGLDFAQQLSEVDDRDYALNTLRELM